MTTNTTPATVVAAGFVAVKDGQPAIFGVGGSEADALADAAQWVDPTVPGAAEGLIAAPATAALLAQVAAEGGAIAWGVVDGGICCTVNEEDGYGR